MSPQRREKNGALSDVWQSYYDTCNPASTVGANNVSLDLCLKKKTKKKNSTVKQITQRFDENQHMTH